MFYDCVIVGAGAVGASLALALGQCNYRVLLLEKNSLKKTPKDNLYESTLGLSLASARIYSLLGIWEKLAPSVVPIECVEVSVRNQLGKSRLKPEKNQPALGYVVGTQDLEVVLYDEIMKVNSIDLLYEASLTRHEKEGEAWSLSVSSNNEAKELTCKLLIAADGANSSLRQSQQIPTIKTTYHHFAMMTNVRLNPSLGHRAIERFLKEGAIALLPWKQNMATCVWTVDEKWVPLLTAYSDQEYQEACQEQLGRRMGQITQIGKRLCIPLQMQLAQRQTSSRFLLMGNAAHSLHPIAAQGFNLSLRDIWQIRTQILQAQQPIDLGSDAFLDCYQKARQMDQKSVVFATDKIARFMSGGPLPNWLRAMGIAMFDCTAPIKSLFTRYSMGMGFVG